MVVDFKTRAKELGYSTTYYPYSETGPKFARRIQKLFIWGTVLLLLGSGSSTLGNRMQANLDTEIATIKAEKGSTEKEINVTLDESGQVTNDQAIGDLNDGIVSAMNGWKLGGQDNDVSLDISTPEAGMGVILKGLGISGLLLVGSLLKLSSGILYLVLLFNVLFYLVNVVRRNREFERNVIINDFKAASLYSKIMRSLRIKKRLSEARKSANSGDKNDDISADNLSKIEELEAMSKMDVRINTRQKLSAPTKLSTMYSIYFDVPFDETTAGNLLKRIENLNGTITRIAQGKVTIGAYQITDDRQKVIFQGETAEIPDPYDYSDAIAKAEAANQVQEKYESAYSIDKFVDRQGTIDEKRELATEWATQNGRVLDRYLITNKMQVTRVGTEVSSSKAVYTYDMALESGLSSGFNKIDEAIDKTFKLKGSSAAIVNGQLEVMLPIPKEYHIPINIPTLYRDAFGDSELVAT